MYTALTIDNRLKDTLLKNILNSYLGFGVTSAWRSNFTPSKTLTLLSSMKGYRNCSHPYYHRLKSFSLQLLTNILMKIDTLHFLCGSGYSTDSTIPSCSGRLGDKHESRHSFDVSVKNKHWKSQSVTAIYSSWGCLKIQGTCSNSLGIPITTASGTVVNTQK